MRHSLHASLCTERQQPSPSVFERHLPVSPFTTTTTSLRSGFSRTISTIRHYPNVDLSIHITSQPPTKTASTIRANTEVAHSFEHLQRAFISVRRADDSPSIVYFTPMADVTAHTPPLPNPGAQQGNHPEQPARGNQNGRGNHRNRRKQAQSIPQADGTVSDSVTNPVASPGAKRQSKQRQSVTTGVPAAAQQGAMGKANGAKARPVSLGGPMLPMTPAKEQAYAGPTFHASPAPSSLPVPKFFSRSVPNVAAPLQARMEGEKTPEKEQSSPEADIVSPAAPRDVPREAVHSPLDMFFKADKEEKQRIYSNGNMLSPEMAARRPAPATEPRNPFQQTRKSIFLHELDGNDGGMPSPKTVPSGERPPPLERAHSSPSARADVSWRRPATRRSYEVSQRLAVQQHERLSITESDTTSNPTARAFGCPRLPHAFSIESTHFQPGTTGIF